MFSEKKLLSKGNASSYTLFQQRFPNKFIKIPNLNKIAINVTSKSSLDSLIDLLEFSFLKLFKLLLK